MKYMKIILFIEILCSMNNNIDSKLKHDYYINNIRSLWEEDMEYKINNENEAESLWHCAKSDYKYFSFILSGAPVTFDHFVSKDNAVSI